MKRKKVMAITAIVFTCATMASCGKATETVNAEPVVQATEQIVLETEKIVQEATEETEEIIQEATEETAPSDANSSASTIPGTEMGDPWALPEGWEDVEQIEWSDEYIESLANQVPDEVWDKAEGMIFE